MKILSLPSPAPKEVIREYFDYIINNNSVFDLYPKEEILELINELAAHQNNHYEKLEPALKNDLENWMIKNFDFHDLRCASWILYIVDKLGLKKVFEQMKIVYNKEITPSKLQKEIQALIKQNPN